MKKVFVLVLVSALVITLWLFYQRGRDLLFPQKYRQIINEVANRYQIEPLLLAAIVSAESSFNPNATSNTGARGLMQIMPSTGKDIARKLQYENFAIEDLYDPTINLNFGCYYLYKLLQTYQDQTLALVAYNAGKTNLNRWLKEASNKDALIDSGLVFPETVKYVHRIDSIYQILQLMDKLQKFES